MVDNAAEKNDNKNIRELRLLEKTKYVPSLYTILKMKIVDCQLIDSIFFHVLISK